MPSYSSAQRNAISEFVAFTQAKESVAAKVRLKIHSTKVSTYNAQFLKSHDWNVERAVTA